MTDLPDSAADIITESLTREYNRGFEDGLRVYAIWKDGIETVGIHSRPLKRVIENVAGIWNYNPPKEK